MHIINNVERNGLLYKCLVSGRERCSIFTIVDKDSKLLRALCFSRSLRCIPQNAGDISAKYILSQATEMGGILITERLSTFYAIMHLLLLTV